MKPSLFFAALVFFQASRMVAQTVSPSPATNSKLPSGPLIQTRAPSFSEWLITTTTGDVENTDGFSGANKAKPGSTKKGKSPSTKLLVTKTDNIIHTEMTDSVGHVWNIWNRDELHLVESAQGNDVGRATRPLDPTQVNPYFFDYSSSDFPGFEWVSAKSFEGVKPFQGKPCLVFRKKGEPQEWVAYTDEDTRLPVTLIDAQGTHVYEYHAAPTAMLTLPANAQQFLNGEQGHVKSVENIPKPTPPPGPLIQTRAPSFSEWLITSTAAPTKPSADSSPNNTPDSPAKEKKIPPQKVLVTKTGNVIHTAMTDVLGHVWNIWNRDALHMVVSPDGKDVGHANRPIDPTQVNPYFFDYSSSDFSGFEWISAENFEGVKPYQGRPCLLFRKKSQAGDAIACTDEETRLPVTRADGEGIYTYEFRAAPTAMQTLPPNVQDFLDAEQRHIKSVANRPIKPY